MLHPVYSVLWDFRFLGTITSRNKYNNQIERMKKKKNEKAVLTVNNNNNNKSKLATALLLLNHKGKTLPAAKTIKEESSSSKFSQTSIYNINTNLSLHFCTA